MTLNIEVTLGTVRWLDVLAVEWDVPREEVVRRMIGWGLWEYVWRKQQASESARFA